MSNDKTKNWRDMTPEELSERVLSTAPEQQEAIMAVLREAISACRTVDHVFRHPMNMLLAGPSQSGKSFFVHQLLKHGMIEPPPRKVVWCYSEWQPLYETLKQEKLVDVFQHGLKGAMSKHVDGVTPTLMIIDDLQDETSKDGQVADMFKKGSHHRNLSVIFIVQNLYFQGKKSRDIALNAHYVVLFKNPADRLQVNNFASRLGLKDFVMQTYRQVCGQPHGHLIFDLTQQSDNSLRSGIPLKDVFTPLEDDY